MSLLTKFLSVTLAAALSLSVQAESLNIDELLNLVKQGQARDNQEFNQRLKRFNAQKTQQAQLLVEAKDQRTRLEQETSGGQPSK